MTEFAMYDPLVGRFLEEDPIDFAAGDPNLFRYVGNNPTNATDPSGLDYMIASTEAGAEAIIKSMRDLGKDTGKIDEGIAVEKTRLPNGHYILRTVGWIRPNGKIEYDTDQATKYNEFFGSEIVDNDNNRYIRHLLRALRPGNKENYYFTGTAAGQFVGKFGEVKEQELITFVEGAGLARKQWVNEPFKYKAKDGKEYTAVVTVVTGVPHPSDPEKRAISISVRSRGDDDLELDFHWLHLTDAYRLNAKDDHVPGRYQDKANKLWSNFKVYKRDRDNQANTLDNPEPKTVFNDLCPSAPRKISSKEVTVYDSPSKGRQGLTKEVVEVGTFHDLYLMSGTTVYFHVHFERYASTKTNEVLMYHKVTGKPAKELPTGFDFKPSAVLAGYKDEGLTMPVEEAIPGFEKK